MVPERRMVSGEFPVGCERAEHSTGLHPLARHNLGTRASMPMPRPLRNCPIVEALFDFRVQVDNALRPSAFDSIPAMSQHGYTRKGPIVEQTFVVGSGANGMHQQSTQQVLGARFHSQDERFVAQFTVQGFTLSRLRPYSNWEELRSEALKVWAIYSAVAVPAAITRVATRYINELLLPVETPMSNLGDYLRGAPGVPGELPGPVANFLQRYVVHDSATGADVIITQALQRPPVPDGLPVLVDVDCFVEKTLDPDAQATFVLLDRLRELKNRVFFGLLTERALDLCQ